MTDVRDASSVSVEFVARWCWSNVIEYFFSGDRLVISGDGMEVTGIPFD